MVAKNSYGLLVLIAALGLLAAICSFSAAVRVGKGVSDTEVRSIINEAVSNIEIPEIPEQQEVNLSGIEQRLANLELELAEGQLMKDKANELVLSALEEREFKKAVFKKLVHITKLKLKDLDIEVDKENEEATAYVDMKVYYYIDGDEEEDKKALLEEFEISVNNLDPEDLEEAEIDESYLDNIEVKKVYK